METLEIECPYCGEVFAVQAGLAEGRLRTIEDCMVCCRPVQIDARIEAGECLDLQVERA